MKAEFHGHSVDFDKIPGITDAEVAFLSGLFEKFERTARGYATFCDTAPAQRIIKAGDILATQPRTGWRLRFPNLPDVFRDVLSTHYGEYEGNRWLLLEGVIKSTESVLEHSAEAQELFALVYDAYPWHHRQWGMECMKFHDFHEAIDGDFTPHCPITKPEKKQLEAISFRLLCEAGGQGNLVALHVANAAKLFEGGVENWNQMRSHMLDVIRSQREQGQIKPYQEKTVAFFEKLYQRSEQLAVKLLQQQTADIDALHMAVRSCRMVKEAHIAPEEREKMEEFWQYIDKKLQTSEARQFFEAFREAYLDDAVGFQAALGIGAMNAHQVRGR